MKIDKKIKKIVETQWKSKDKRSKGTNTKDWNQEYRERNEGTGENQEKTKKEKQ